MWFISFSRAVTVENCHNSTIVLGVTKTAVNVIGCDSCSFFAVCDRVSIRFVLIPSHGSTQLAKCAQLLLWNIVESLRSGNDNEDEYEFCPREVWYFVFALVLVSTQFVSFDWKNKQVRVLHPGFLRAFKGRIRVTTTRMLYEDDTLDEGDVLMTFHESEVHNSPL